MCSGRTPIIGFNDLGTTHPDLAKEADGWDPTTFKQFSNKRVRWKCQLGHSWDATIGSRVQGSGCPLCSGRVPIRGVTDLASIHPVLAAQADGWDPTTVTAQSGRKLAWKCAAGHSWKAIVSNRLKGRGCPICANKKVLAGFNDLATTHPAIAKEADGWDPSTLIAGSHVRVRWKCDRGHSWEAPPHYRLKGSGCPVCTGHKVQVGFNDLATVQPDLAGQANGWDPTSVTSGSGKKLGWQCELGHLWFASVAGRKGGSGCPVCAGQLVVAGVNDLATLHPAIAAEADGWDPSTVTAGSGATVRWRCKTGHSWVTSVKTRVNGSGCPVCANRVVLAGFNDLATTHPELAAEADGWDPTMVTAGSQKRVGWRCARGHTWTAVLGSRLAGSGCPVCANRVVLAGFNDLATTHPELAAEADGWDPTTVVCGSNKKVQWRCSKGHTWHALIFNRARGVGCPTCATFGFDPNRDSWLYLIDHDALQMFQVGISNFPDSRLGNHARRGWEVIDIRGPIDGHLARQLETAILHAVERRGAVLGHQTSTHKFDGYSEAWTKESLKVTTLRQILDWVYEDEAR
jgi:hypothetical protein